ncbi:MAG TPA: GNAT family N-acetyltransferase [Alphaproteobacteria bacterium]|nr:GNAT family N-acetyltransferase [Alphaproteobacteria bacterium]
MKSVTFKIVEHASCDYQNALSLREDVLRKPLGLSLTSEEQLQEKDHIHIAGFLGEDLCATVSLVPQEGKIKMRQVAVRADCRSKGIASAMLQFCEDYALYHEFNEIYCYARETVVSFYLKNNYLREGEPFIEQTILHVKMRKDTRRK